MDTNSKKWQDNKYQILVFMEENGEMKKSFKTGVCKALTTIACATFMFAGALGLGSITAKAASRVYPIDLSNGRTTGVNENELTDEHIIPQGVKDFYMLITVMELYMDEIRLSHLIEQRVL